MQENERASKIASFSWSEIVTNTLDMPKLAYSQAVVKLLSLPLQIYRCMHSMSATTLFQQLCRHHGSTCRLDYFSCCVLDNCMVCSVIKSLVICGWSIARGFTRQTREPFCGIGGCSYMLRWHETVDHIVSNKFARLGEPMALLFSSCTYAAAVVFTVIKYT